MKLGWVTRLMVLALALKPPEKLQHQDAPNNYKIWDAEARRQIIRELIVHEDKLSSERMQALYTLQGLLFAALGIVVGKELPLACELKVILTIVAFTGSVAAWLYFKEFRHNTKAILDLLNDWKKVKRDHQENTPPRIIGYESPKQTRPMGARGLTRKTIPLIFIGVWVLVVAIVWLRL
jgi:hypothetical protein